MRPFVSLYRLADDECPYCGGEGCEYCTTPSASSLDSPTFGSAHSIEHLTEDYSAQENDFPTKPTEHIGLNGYSSVASSYKQGADTQSQWIQRRDALRAKYPHKLEPDVSDKEGWSLKRLSNGGGNAFKYEGDMMNNCVANYSHEEDNDDIYSLRDPDDVPHATFRMGPSMQSHQVLRISDLYGRNDEAAADEHLERILKMTSPEKVSLENGPVRNTKLVMKKYQQMKDAHPSHLYLGVHEEARDADGGVTPHGYYGGEVSEKPIKPKEDQVVYKTPYTPRRFAANYGSGDDGRTGLENKGLLRSLLDGKREPKPTYSVKTLNDETPSYFPKNALEEVGRHRTVRGEPSKYRVLEPAANLSLRQIQAIRKREPFDLRHDQFTDAGPADKPEEDEMDGSLRMGPSQLTVRNDKNTHSLLAAHDIMEPDISVRRRLSDYHLSNPDAFEDSLDRRNESIKHMADTNKAYVTIPVSERTNERLYPGAGQCQVKGHSAEPHLCLTATHERNSEFSGRRIEHKPPPPSRHPPGRNDTFTIDLKKAPNFDVIATPKERFARYGHNGIGHGEIPLSALKRESNDTAIPKHLKELLSRAEVIRIELERFEPKNIEVDLSAKFAALDIPQGDCPYCENTGCMMCMSTPDTEKQAHVSGYQDIAAERPDVGIYGHRQAANNDTEHFKVRRYQKNWAVIPQGDDVPKSKWSSLNAAKKQAAHREHGEGYYYDCEQCSSTKQAGVSCPYCGDEGCEMCLSTSTNPVNNNQPSEAVSNEASKKTVATKMYHVAPRNLRDAIDKEGLKSWDAVYLWKDRRDAQSMKQDAESEREDFSSGPHDVYEVETDGLELHPDPAYQADWSADGDPNDTLAYYTTKPVPKEHVKRIDNNHVALVLAYEAAMKQAMPMDQGLLKNVEFRHSADGPTGHKLVAWLVDPEKRHMQQPLGEMNWAHDESTGDAKVNWVSVRPEYQHHGIATQMYRKAQEISPKLHHDTLMNTDSREWAKSLDEDSRKWVNNLAIPPTDTSDIEDWLREHPNPMSRPRDYFKVPAAKAVDEDMQFYHVSPAKNRESIQKRGLIPSWDYDGPQGVFLHGSAEDAEHFARTWVDKKEDADIWKVDLTGRWVPYEDPNGIGFNAHYTNHRISPKRLNLHKTLPKKTTSAMNETSRLSMLMKQADEDQCAYCSGDSLPAGKMVGDIQPYRCQDCQKHWFYNTATNEHMTSDGVVTMSNRKTAALGEDVPKGYFVHADYTREDGQPSYINGYYQGQTRNGHKFSFGKRKDTIPHDRIQSIQKVPLNRWCDKSTVSRILSKAGYGARSHGDTYKGVPLQTYEGYVVDEAPNGYNIDAHKDVDGHVKALQEFGFQTNVTKRYPPRAPYRGAPADPPGGFIEARYPPDERMPWDEPKSSKVAAPIVDPLDKLPEYLQRHPVQTPQIHDYLQTQDPRATVEQADFHRLLRHIQTRHHMRGMLNIHSPASTRANHLNEHERGEPDHSHSESGYGTGHVIERPQKYEDDRIFNAKHAAPDFTWSAEKLAAEVDAELAKFAGGGNSLYSDEGFAGPDEEMRYYRKNFHVHPRPVPIEQVADHVLHDHPRAAAQYEYYGGSLQELHEKEHA